MRSIPWLKVAVFVVLLGALVVFAELRGADSIAAFDDQVRSSGAQAWVIYPVGYALLALTPAPKAVLNVLAGAVFGLVWGTVLTMIGAMAGAVLAFELARLLGRETVERISHGKLQRIDELLRDHGLIAVVAVRLVPILPYTAVNYACGLAGVTRRDYFWGSLLGMFPASIAFVALGAYGAEPWKLALAISALVALVIGGGAWGRSVLGLKKADV